MKSLALILFSILFTVKASPKPNDFEDLFGRKKQEVKNEDGRTYVSIKRVRGLRISSFNLLGGGYPGFVGASVSSHINKRIEYEVGIGVISAFAGLKYYIISPLPQKIALNVGYNAGIIAFANSSGFYQYIPIEVKYFTRNNISFGFNAGYWFQDSVNSRIWGGVSVGFRFGKQMNNYR